MLKLKLVILFLFFLTGLVNLKADWHIADSLVYYKPGDKYPYAVFFQEILSSKKGDILALSNLSTAPCIIKSTDKGNSWKIKLLDWYGGLGNEEYFPSRAETFCYPDTNFALIACDSGYYYISENNGELWNKYRFENKKRITGVYFWDNKRGITVQPDSLIKQIIQKTTDGGKSWFRIPGPKLVNATYTSNFITFENGFTYFIEMDNKVDSAYFFHKSTDYGETWQEPYLSLKLPPYVGFTFLNEKVGFCFGGKHFEEMSPAYSKLIKRTSDGGRSWITVLDTSFILNDPITDISFSDSLHGVASAISNVFRTTDGGFTWAWDSTFIWNKFPYILQVLMIDSTSALGLSHQYYILKTDFGNITYIDNDFAFKQLNVFPNPAGNSLNIEIPDGFDESIEYSIFSLNGVELKYGSLSPQIDINELRPGIYYLIIRKDKKVLSSKFVKK